MYTFTTSHPSHSPERPVGAPGRPWAAPGGPGQLLSGPRAAPGGLGQPPSGLGGPWRGQPRAVGSPGQWARAGLGRPRAGPGRPGSPGQCGPFYFGKISLHCTLILYIIPEVKYSSTDPPRALTAVTLLPSLSATSLLRTSRCPQDSERVGAQTFPPTDSLHDARQPRAPPKQQSTSGHVQHAHHPSHPVSKQPEPEHGAASKTHYFCGLRLAP